VKDVMSRCDVLLIQEHWYFDDDIHKLIEFTDNVNVHGISAMEKHQATSCWWEDRMEAAQLCTETL
jgi:HD-like signal output (HDOD) protein